MKVLLHKNFIKNYSKRIKPYVQLHKQYEKRFSLFLNDPFDVRLKNHRLKGSENKLRSFSISGDIRVIYSERNGSIVFLDIGSHNQVYT